MERPSIYLILFSYLIFTPSSRQEEQIDLGKQENTFSIVNNENGWLKRFNQLFYEDHDDLKSPREIIRELERLHAESFQVSNNSNEGLVKDRAMRVFELIKLSHVFPNSCTGSMFSNLDSLAMEYSVGYNIAISKYIRYFRDQFWLTCERSFIGSQRPNVGLVYRDSMEAFSMVDHVNTALNGLFDASNLSAEINPQAILRGIINYIEAKLKDDSSVVDKSKIDELFVDTILPVCGSVRYRFIGKAKMEEIINGREDLKNRLDSTSIKWLMAKKICSNILAKLIYFRDEVLKQEVPLNV